ncbi:hypothetical protein IMCC1989_2224 [gamma proteobacterium IMCC1989]|nr:hypothetical protein IMCC1989_2224 [gamma proteobacterium IMCC1989]
MFAYSYPLVADVAMDGMELASARFNSCVSVQHKNIMNKV